MRSHKPSWFRAVLLLCALGPSACDSGGAGAGQPPPPTLIVVSPDQFAKNVACLPDPGAMRSYVATLFDVTPDYDSAAEPALPSSPPTDCAVDVGFGFVQPGRKYRAEIDAYDRSDLRALTPGNRLMQESGSAPPVLVPPRWRASCGNVMMHDTSTSADAASDAGVDLSFLNGPAEAFLNASVVVKGCTPFVEIQARPTRTSIRVDLSDALGQLECGSGPGQLFDYSVTQLGTTTFTQHALCNNSVLFTTVKENVLYNFSVDAFERPRVPDAGMDASLSSLGDASLGDASPSGGSLGDASAPATNSPDATSLDGAISDAAQPDAQATATMDAGPIIPATAAPRWHTTCYQRAATGVERTAVCEPLEPVR
ncbi:MAG TPA: hypothetical protein VL137_04365 [Polyangiaceae bacterium]|nr:hypothetical protein [Polyangiaceae bacterium]